MKKFVVLLILCVMVFTGIYADELEVANQPFNLLYVFSNVTPAPPKADGIDYTLDTAINFGNSNVGPDQFGFGFGQAFGGFSYALNINTFYNMIFSGNYGICIRTNIDISGGKFGLFLGGTYNVIENNNYIISVNVGPSMLLGNGYFQFGAEVIGNYNFYFAPNWYAKVSAPIEMLFFDTVNKGGFSMYLVIPSLSLGYKF